MENYTFGEFSISSYKKGTYIIVYDYKLQKEFIVNKPDLNDNLLENLIDVLILVATERKRIMNLIKDV